MARLLKSEDCKPARFNKCLDFERALTALVELYKGLQDLTKSKTRDKWLAYTATLIIALLNGARIREALRAIKLFYETGETHMILRAEKKGSLRRIIIPGFINRKDLTHVYKTLIEKGEERARKNIEMWFSRNMGATPHTLRYSFIEYLSKKLDVERIAEVVGLKEARTITRYYLRQREEERGELE